MNQKDSSDENKKMPVELEGITDYTPWCQFYSFKAHEAACIFAGYHPKEESAEYSDDIKSIIKGLRQVASGRQGNRHGGTFLDEIWIEEMEEYARIIDSRSRFLEFRDSPPVAVPSNMKAFDEIKSELKEIKTKLENLGLENRRLNFQIKGEYMDSEHSLFAPELEAAISAWMDLFASGEDIKNKGKASKTLIRKWLKENRSNLTTAAMERIEVLSNPQAYKAGGAPKTDY
jgi:hypothetical protein